MKQVFLDQACCPAGHPCPVIRVCPAGAVSQSSAYDAPVINMEKCTHCGRCTRFCPYGAFQIE